MTEIAQETIESPCIRHCTLDEDDVCLGCGRLLQEITGWAKADNETRRQYLFDSARRKQKKAVLMTL